MKKLLFLLFSIWASYNYAQTTLLVNEDFNGTTIPGAWTTDGIYGEAGTTDEGWTFGSGNVFSSTDFPTNAAVFSDFAAGNDGLHNRAGLYYSEGLDVSSYGGPLALSYDYSFSNYDAEGEQQFQVAIWDNTNTNYITIRTYNTDSSGIISEYIDLRPFINSNPGIDPTNLIFAFFYDDLTGGWGDGVGVDNVKFEVYEAPSNDSITDAIYITDELNSTNYYSNTQDATGATNNEGFKTTCGDGFGEDGAMNDGVWYSFMIFHEGYVTVTVTPDSSWDPEITIYNCESSCDVNCIASADDGLEAGISETLTFHVNPPFLTGNSYTINIGAFAASADMYEGNFEIEVSFNCGGSTPINDEIENAIQVPNATYTDTAVSLPCANQDSGFVGCTMNSYRKPVFYKFIATESTEVTASVEEGSPYLLDIAFFEAPSLEAIESDLVFVEQDTNNCGSDIFGSSSIITEAGHYYYVVIAGPYESDIIINGVLDTTSISDTIIDGFEMFPNPSKNTITLNATNKIEIISIYNLIGQKLITTTPNETNTQIDISGLSAGSYIIKVKANDKTGTYNLLRE